MQMKKFTWFIISFHLLILVPFVATHLTNLCWRLLICRFGSFGSEQKWNFVCRLLAELTLDASENEQSSLVSDYAICSHWKRRNRMNQRNENKTFSISEKESNVSDEQRQKRANRTANDDNATFNTYAVLSEKNVPIRWEWHRTYRFLSIHIFFFFDFLDFPSSHFACNRMRHSPTTEKSENQIM